MLPSPQAWARLRGKLPLSCRPRLDHIQVVYETIGSRRLGADTELLLMLLFEFAEFQAGQDKRSREKESVHLLARTETLMRKELKAWIRLSRRDRVNLTWGPVIVMVILAFVVGAFASDRLRPAPKAVRLSRQAGDVFTLEYTSLAPFPAENGESDR